MDEQIQQPVARPGFSVSPLHIVIIALLVIILGGLAYLIWQQVIDQAGVREQLTIAEQGKASLTAELTETKRLLDEEKAKPVATPAITDEVIYQSEQDNFRIVTTPDCKGVFAVRPGSPMPEYRATARYDISLANSASEWYGKPFRALLKIDSEELLTLQADPKSKNDMALNSLSLGDSTPIYVSPERDFRLFGFLDGDGPALEELQNPTRTGSCRYVVQAVPVLGE